MASEPHDNPAGFTAEQALERLKQGNARFVAGESHFPTLQTEVLAALAKGQQPYATILGCSDSRVPPELLFDAGLGELFIVRVAGNVLGPTVSGSLQYASTQLHTPLFVVLGHQGCGAIKAALANKMHQAQHPERIALLLEAILPALEGVNTTLAEPELLASAVEANVRHTVKALEESQEGRKHMASGDMKLLGAIYDLDSGSVRFLE
jgi:carbonic anhydrase